jgi:hypothetical protein
LPACGGLSRLWGACPPAEGLPAYGGVAEWTKAVVLKTTEQQCSGGSNPSPSADQLPAVSFQLPASGCQKEVLGAAWACAPSARSNPPAADKSLTLCDITDSERYTLILPVPGTALPGKSGKLIQLGRGYSAPSTSRTLRAKTSAVKGLGRKASPGSCATWWTTASSA